MSFCPNDDFSSEPLSITIQNENWRGNINRAIAIGQSLLSLTTIIQNVHSVVLNGEGDELYQRMMKMENNENIVDEIVWKLLKMQENVAEKLSEMKIAAGPIWRPSEPVAAPVFSPVPVPLMSVVSRVPKPFPGLPSKRRREEWRRAPNLNTSRPVPKQIRKQNDDGTEDYTRDNYGFLNFENIQEKHQQARKISEYLGMCRIKVDAFNIVIYHSGPMFSSTSADRLYISFDVEDDERAVQDMHRLFFHEKCKPIDQLNIQLFGNDTSRHLTLVRGLNPFAAYKFDMASKFFRTLKEVYPPFLYSILLQRGSMFIENPTGQREILSCANLYQRFPGVFDEEYRKMNYSGRRLLKKLTRRVDKSIAEALK